MITCAFCGNTGKEGDGLFHYNLAMTRIGREPGWAHHRCMIQGAAAHANDPHPAAALPTKVAPSPVPQDPAHAPKTAAKKAARVLAAKQPDPPKDAAPAPKAAAPAKVKAPKLPRGDDPYAGRTVDDLLAEATKLGYVEQPAPNGGVRVMRIRNFLNNHAKKNGQGQAA